MNERPRGTDSGCSSGSREAGIQARMWQFPLAASHLAEFQMRKQNKKAGVWILPGGGEELEVCQVNQPQFSQCLPALRPEAKANLTPLTLPALSHRHMHKGL